MANDFFEPHVDESILPSDDTPSLGSNYGLDGFQFDSEYKDGVLDGARLPEVKGLSGLPDGIIHTAAPYDFASGVMLGEPEGSYHGTNLEEMLSENSLAGLGWLHGEQDPDRLPKNPVDRGIMELEKAWGVHNRTTGILVPNKVYRAESNDPHQEGFDRVEAGDLVKLVKQAMRRSAYGYPLKEVIKEAAILPTRLRTQIASDMQRVVDDHGLRGKVFIEAVAFPGLKNGKYANEIHRHCASAQYIVVPKSMDAGTRERIASLTGKTVVTTVPWKDAFEFYAPRLQSTGHRVASGGSYKERLKATFAAKVKVAHQSAAPVQMFAVDQISAAEAQRKFAAMRPEQVLVIQKAMQEQAKAKQAAAQQLSRWVKAGLIDAAKAHKIAKSAPSAKSMLKQAADAIAESGYTVSYEGQGLGAASVREQFHRPVASPVDSVTLRQAKWVMEQMNEGWAGKKLSDLIRKRFAGKVASGAIANIRKAHEGLAGHVYVDASVYASDKGSSGCDNGALKHRANTLRYVLAMDRCASCVHATEGKCQKYAKTLLDSNEGLEKLQKQNIKAADMTDAEVTGSLFAPSYKQADYGLQYNENLDLMDEMNPEALDEVLMDGVATCDNGGDLYGGIELDDVGF